MEDKEFDEGEDDDPCSSIIHASTCAEAFESSSWKTCIWQGEIDFLPFMFVCV